MKLSIIFNLIAIIPSIIIFYLVRKNRLHLTYSLFWLIICTIIFTLGLFPGINIKIAQALGIQYYPVLPIVIAIAIIFIRMVQQDIQLTKKEIQIKRLIQEIAILKKEIKKRK